jgi:single-stranded DNA-binding protein
MNVVVLEGRLSGPPQERVLASGSRVLSLQLTMDRRPDQRAADSVPVAWFDPKGSQFDFEDEQRLVVVGRVVRRFFQAASGVQSRTEVVAERVIPATRKASVRTALASVVQQIADGLEPREPKD